jgi:sulfate adenylyltransferase subunit 2
MTTDIGRALPGTLDAPMQYELSHLDTIEAEAIHVMREVVAEFERPVLLCSGGKDSLVMVHVAVKAFWPCKLPFPIMHVDTGLNFPEVIEFRDRLVDDLGCKLVVASVQESIDRGRVQEQTGPLASRNRLQISTLLDGIEDNRFDSVFGGGRRDEEKARAKERFYSHRDDFGQWDPKGQRPELWNLYNGRHRAGEHFRIFPISNWTELDVWQYIEREKIALPSIYFAHDREVFERDGMLLAADFAEMMEREEAFTAKVRYRTLGDANITGAVESEADTIEKIVAEVAATRVTERGATRADDRTSEAAMEDRKKEGYF